MKDFAIGGIIGITQTVLGHPLDTIKVRIQNKQNWKDLKFKNYYRGCLYPLSGSLVYNMIAFPVYERTIEYTNSHLLSGFISGLAVSPVVFCSEVGKIRQQTKQPISLQTLIKSRGILSTTARETIAMSTYFLMYKYAKNDLKFNPMFAGSLAGLANWTLTYPFDIVKSRQIAQGLTIRDAIKMGNLWRGYPVCALRAIIVNGVIFYTYETVKNVLEN